MKYHSYLKSTKIDVFEQKICQCHSPMGIFWQTEVRVVGVCVCVCDAVLHFCYESKAKAATSKTKDVSSLNNSISPPMFPINFEFFYKFLHFKRPMRV